MSITRMLTSSWAKRMPWQKSTEDKAIILIAELSREKAAINKIRALVFENAGIDC